MSGTIHLIVEDKSDKDVVEAILRAKGINVRIRHLIPTGAQGGISRLARQLERLIRTAIANRRIVDGDCIAVLHDADEQAQPDRTLYSQIESICNKYRQDVKLVVARDEIEAWLLADEGLCNWLGERARNCDSEPKPSQRLNEAVKRKTGHDYSTKTRTQALEKLDGSGDKYSESMRDALAYLQNAPCMRST